MADHFDPYHKWLGIPPTEQPPNHYRLLGVALYESDPDVIDAAANRQMAYLHQCATGPQLKYSQKLLNEVSAARLCLLNPQSKSTYDAGLKQALQPAPAPQTTRVVKKVVRVVRAAETEAEPEPEVAAPVIPGFDPDASSTPYRRRRGGIGAIIAVVLILGLIGGGSWYFWNKDAPSGDQDSNPSQPEGNNSIASTDNPKPTENNTTENQNPVTQTNQQPGNTRPDNTGNPRTTPTGNTGNGNTQPVSLQTLKFKNTVGMEFMPLPAGKFMMGAKPGPLVDGDEMPEHEVQITKAFYMGVTEVTQKQWSLIMGESSKSEFQGDDLPVENRRWRFAVKFCNALSLRETRRYRLPTEAEWEYAARAGATTRYSYGDDESQLDDYAWFRQNSNFQTHPVARKKPNAWGLYDMHGNVAEWCQDFYWRDWYRNSPTDDPTGPTEAKVRQEETELAHLARGGHWDTAGTSCRLTYRGVGRDEIDDEHIGFRVVLEMTPEEIAKITGVPILNGQSEETAELVPATIAVVDSPATQPITEEHGWDDIPQWLTGASIHNRVAPEQGTIPARELSLTAQEGGLVVLLVSWEYDGNSEGGWQENRTSKEKLLQDGWKELGTISRKIRANFPQREYTILAKVLPAKTELRFHTLKYNPPLAVAVTPSHLSALLKEEEPRRLLAADLNPVPKPENNPTTRPMPENNPATTPVPNMNTTPATTQQPVAQESYWPKVAPLLQDGKYDEAVTTLKNSQASAPESEQETLKLDIADLEQVAALQTDLLEILRRLPANSKIRVGGIGSRTFLRFEEASLSVVVQSGSSEKKIPLNELRISEWRLLFPVTRINSATDQLAWAILYAYHPQGEPDRADEIFKQLQEKTPTVERWLKRTSPGADG